MEEREEGSLDKNGKRALKTRIMKVFKGGERGMGSGKRGEEVIPLNVLHCSFTLL